MALRDFLRAVPRRAAIAAQDLPLLERLRKALQTPPHPNRYVSPRLRTVDAVLLTLRGYRVMWTTPTEYDDTTPNPSTLCYVSCGRDAWNPFGDVLTEAPTILPGEVHRAASWLVSGYSIGWRFAAWQVQREAQWMLQRRQNKRQR